MPKVHTVRKNRSGKEIKCGRCGAPIEPGQKYHYWEPRYGPKQVRCQLHYPKRSETTTSKMSEVYAAIEMAEEEMTAYDGRESDYYEEVVQAVEEMANQVADEYRDAAEHFGGTGENAERADELEDFSSNLTSFSAPEFASWWKENAPDDLEEDALTAWREYCQNEVNDALSEVV
jgi:hypothetical protein